MNNLPRLQSVIAPLATPVAPAAFLANEVYRAMMIVNFPAWLALGCAIVTIAGIESTGALACVSAIRAWQRKSYTAMWIAIFGAVVYAAIVWAGIATMAEERARIFGVMVLLTLVAYAVYAMYTGFDKTDTEQSQAAAVSVGLLDAERKLTNAKTRQIKAGAVSSVQMDKIGQTGQPIGQVTPSGQRVIDYLNANGDGESLRQIADAVGIKSPSTVDKWLKYWRRDA